VAAARPEPITATASDGDTVLDLYDRRADGTLRLLTPDTAVAMDAFANRNALSADGTRVSFSTTESLADADGDLQLDSYSVPTAGGASRNLTNSPEVAESALLMAPDGRSVALSHKRGDEGQINLAVLSRASGAVRLLTHEADRPRRQ